MTYFNKSDRNECRCSSEEEEKWAETLRNEACNSYSPEAAIIWTIEGLLDLWGVTPSYPWRLVVIPQMQGQARTARAAVSRTAEKE